MEDVVDNSRAFVPDALLESARPFPDFSEASKHLVTYLRKITGFQLCAVTRIDDNEVFFLSVDDGGYGIKAGDTLRIEETLYPLMVSGQVPSFTNEFSDFGNLAPPSLFKIAAHFGVPLTLSDGSVFGTLCGFNPDPMPESAGDHVETIQSVARLLSTILCLELKSLDQRRSYERVKEESERDELTGLLNRRGWDRALVDEEGLCLQYGFTASVIVIDLDNLKVVNDSRGHKAGDDVLCRAAEVIEQTSRSGDVVARTGGDEFAVMTKGITHDGLSAFARRIRIALMVAGVSASVGTSARTVSKTLTDAWTEADAAMYVSKRSKG